MRHLFFFTFYPLLITTSCNDSGGSNYSVNNRPILTTDSLFELDYKIDENFVKINPPNTSEFSLPDSSSKTEPYQFGDFNADGKEDVMVYLGACGTGGCMYGLFLNQFENYYKLVFYEYLKGPEFVIEKNGFWVIKSFEEVEAYDPSQLYVSIYKFNPKTYYYTLDTLFISVDKLDD